MENKIVSRWLSTRAVFSADETPLTAEQEALYDRYRDDEAMLKAHGLIPSSNAKEFAPQLIDLDEIVGANPTSAEFPNCSHICYFNGKEFVIKVEHEKLTEMLLEREVYTETTRSELLKILISKVG